MIIRCRFITGIYNLIINKQIKIINVINYLNKKEKKKKKIIFTNEFKFPNFAKLNVTKINNVLKMNMKFNFFKDLDNTMKYWKNKRL